jgi:hypothetical protein
MGSGKVELLVDRLSEKHATSNSYGILLKERQGNRRLLILIGAFEAQAIAIEIEGLKPMRPLTHDLFKNMAKEFGIELKEVLINNIKEGIFFSKLICSDGIQDIEIDARTSDALALAVRFHCPIYTYEAVLKQAGYTHEGTYSAQEQAVTVQKAVKKPEVPLYELSKAELQRKLENALDSEDYELAAQVRDELTKRKDV